jgi:hypothetical protein
VKRILKLALPLILLAAAVPEVKAQTNIDYWVQSLSLALTGSTNAGLVTNGIVARTKAGTVKFSAKELINALNHKPAYRLTSEIVTNTFVETNVVHKTNVYLTNTVVAAVPVFTLVTNPVYSTSAKLILKTQLGTNDSPPLVIIRDGLLPTDFVIADYFQIRSISFDNRPLDLTVSGKFDIVHDIEDVTRSSIKGFTFNSNSATNFPPTGTYFDVQGFTTEQSSALIENGQLIDRSVSRSASSSVAGTGQLGTPANFMVLRGTISLGRGKHEIE